MIASVLSARESLRFTPPHIAPPEAQLPRLQSLKVMLDNPIEGWPRAIYDEPLYVPPRRDFPLVYLCEPEAIRAVLVDHAAAFPKAPVWMRLLKPLLGEGLLTAEGAQWRWQRHAAAPAFQPRQVMKCGDAIGAAAERAIDRWRQGPKATTRDMASEFVQMTFEVILDAMFSGRDEYDVGALSQAFAAYVAELGKPGLLDLVGAPAWLRRLTAPDAHDAVAYLRSEVDRMIARRRREPARGDLIDALSEARDPATGRAMSDSELRDNLLTFMAGGHETTALALTWALFLIAQHPESQERIRKEALAVAGAGPISALGAGQLQFTKQVIQEAMRLYPPLPALSRVCRQDRTIAGRATRPGEIMVIPIYALHRHRLYWDSPDCYDPDRFAPHATRGARRYIYMPFGGGQRVCIGAAFAMLEATIILASLVRAAEFEACDPSRLRPLLRITLRPEGGLPTKVRLRSSNQAPHAI